jgi:steroid 5-alpha reductase family enzyme
MSYAAVLGLVAGVLAGCVVALWLLSVRLRDASIVDIFWGPAFAIAAWLALLAGPGAGGATRGGWLLTGLVTVWALRLGAYLAWRNIGAGEDYRYRAMRKRWGDRFPLISLGMVFGLQGGLVVLVSMPLTSALAAPQADANAWLLWPGVALWTVGLFFEAVGDLQLARFKAEPANAGKVMDRGLWRYTRHPNYFGDFCVWWGLFAVACGVGAPWWTVVGPLVMSWLLLKVSGVALLEGALKKRRPGYEAYVARTSAFFPWPPRSKG